MISMTITPQALDALRRLRRFPGEWIAHAMGIENELTVARIQRTKLSRRGPDTLGVRTGLLRRSVHPAAPMISGTSVISGIGSNVRYMAPHEFGIDRDVQVRAHSRHGGAGDTFKVGKDWAMTRSQARKRGLDPRNLTRTAMGFAQVSAHSRHMILPARAPIRRSIQERIANYGRAISEAIMRAWSNRQS